MRKYIELYLTTSMVAALERYMEEQKISLMNAAAAQILIDFLYKGGYF
jgi:hypothetical protein